MHPKFSSLVLIQARLSSTRLPAKSILPITGVPLIVLAAQRAANTGRLVRIVTSTEIEDNYIAEELAKYNIDYFRGDLSNVLKRFCDALGDVPNETKVWRLTGDNPLVDGNFLDEMELFCNKEAADIYYSDANEIGMPVGISAELTSAGWLRQAHKNTDNTSDIEHVTPYIYRNGTSLPFASNSVPQRRNLKVGVDTFVDYLAVRSLFESVADPVNINIQTLLSNSNHMIHRPNYEPAKKPMTLGSVQFGIDYGITNANGMVSEKEATSIIRHAIIEGVQYIDTAAAYGDSERVIGKSLTGGWSNRVKLITKLAPFDRQDLADVEGKCLSFMVKNSFLQSCVNLKVNHIDTFMLHRADHLKYAQILNELMKLRNEGAISNIGVSVQSPQELEVVLKNKDVSVIQTPYNILDYRWDSIIDLVRREREKRSLIIHARSALLQGLLCSEDASKWLQARIKNSTEIVDWLKSKFKQYQKMSVSDLCIGYVNSQDWIDSVVIGVESEKNLFSNLQSISMPLMPREALDELATSRPHVEAESLNPSNWRANV